jgi:hypothetical protein
MRKLIVLVVGTALLCTGLVLADPVANPAGINAQQAQAQAAVAKTPTASAEQARTQVQPSVIGQGTSAVAAPQRPAKPQAKSVTPITPLASKEAPTGRGYYVYDAPFDGPYLSTCGAGNNCGLRSTEDEQYEIHIPYAGVWAFDLCNSSFDTYIYLGTSNCSNDLGENDDYCGLMSYMQLSLPAGTVYLDVEGFSSCGTYQVRCYEVVVPMGACCVGGVCVATTNQADCQGMGGHWYQGETCPEFACPGAPPNDLCQNAWVVDLPGDVTYNGDNTGASEECSYLSGGVYRDVWFVLNVPETMDVSVRMCGTSPAFYNAYIVMDPYCPCSGAWVYASTYDNTSCGDGNWSLYWLALPPGTYYWPLLTDSAGGYAEGPYTVTFHGGAPTGACCVGTDCVGDMGPDDCAAIGGVWYQNQSCAFFTCPDLTLVLCPADSIFDQGPCYLPTDPWSAYTSGIDPAGAFEYTCFENFSVSAPIEDLHWWGLSLYCCWSPCDPTGMGFEIKFYADQGGFPDYTNPTCQYLVDPTIVDTGYNYYGIYFWYRFDADMLIPCCFQSTGWVSIKSVTSPSGCVFLWMNGPTGDFNSYQMPAGGVPGQLGANLAYCLSTGTCEIPYGACCIDSIPYCYENMSAIECMALHGRFGMDLLCAQLVPLCGEITGACCHPDGTCDITTSLNCPDLWLGPNTQCSACPCIVPCPPNGIPEPEACGEDLDGGCNIAPPMFAPIECGQTICGTAWASYSYRDTDWYQLTTTDAFIYDWSIEAEFPVLIFIIHGAGPDDCSSYTIVTYATAGECTPLSINSGQQGFGTYWFWAGSSTFANYPCPLRYTATLNCTPWTPPTGACCVNMVCVETDTQGQCAAIGGHWYIGQTCPEFVCPETCADFLVTAPGTWNGNTCGAGNDCQLHADTEDIMYEIILPEDGLWTFSLCGSDYDTYIFLGTDCCTQDIGYNDDYCGLQSQLSVFLTAGHYFLTIEGYCCSECGNYLLNVYVQETCEITCPPGATQEPEPCGEDLDGGCNIVPPMFAPITCDETICGTAWANYSYRDTDWYQITIDDNTNFTWSACSDFQLLMFIMQGAGPDDCSSYLILTYSTAAPFTQLTLSAAGSAGGTYWFWIGPSTWYNLPCDAHYVATLTTDPNVCMCGDLNHDGQVTIDDYWMFLDAFGSCLGDPKWNPEANFDGQNCITLVDYQYWLQCYYDAQGKAFVPPAQNKTSKINQNIHR